MIGYAPQSDDDLKEMRDKLRSGARQASAFDSIMLINELLLWRAACRRNEEQLARVTQLQIPFGVAS
jgi:hypothetical protein